MCRNIKMLFNFDPPSSPDEIHAASLQFVRKISGFNKPSKANEEAFFSAISAIDEAVELAGNECAAEEPRGRSGAHEGSQPEALRRPHKISSVNPRQVRTQTHRI